MLRFLDVLGPLKWPSVLAISVVPVAAYILDWRYHYEAEPLALYGPEALGPVAVVLSHAAAAAPLQAPATEWTLRLRALLPLAAPPPAKPDAAIDVAGLRAGWQALQDTHEFFQLLKRFSVTRLQALRLAGPELARRVTNVSHREALETACTVELPIMVFVGSPGVVQIHSGPIFDLKAVGHWFNILAPGFSLHLREDGIASSWVVVKPTVDGPVSALELYDSDGGQIVQFFSKRKPGQTEPEVWRQILHDLPVG